MKKSVLACMTALLALHSVKAVEPEPVATNAPSRAITVGYDVNTGLWQQMSKQRPVEQDIRVIYDLDLPFIKKKLEVNWTQVRNLGAAASSLVLGAVLHQKAYHKPYIKKSSDQVAMKSGDEKENIQNEALRGQYETVRPWIVVSAIISSGMFGYQYLNGEQKSPFRFIDAAQETEAA